MLKLLNLDPDNYSKKAYSILGTYADIDDYNGLDSLGDIIGCYDILLLRFSKKIDSDILDKAINLKIIACNATGVDHIDVIKAEQKGIKIVSLKGEFEFLETIHATAELTWGLLLSLVRKIPDAYHDVLNGSWNRDVFIANELYGKRIGILGYGRIGKKIAGYAHAFGMQVFAYDDQEKEYAPYVNVMGSLKSLLSESDVFTIHIPYNELTHCLLKKQHFSLLPRGAFIINTSRGAIIKENDLVSVLESGHVSAAAIDVLDGENDKDFLKNNPLFNYAKYNNNLIVTPHIGGVTNESWEKTEVFIAEKIIQLLQV